MDIRQGEAVAELLFVEWLELFGDDYYIELQRHNIPEQDICNEVLVRWATKYNDIQAACGEDVCMFSAKAWRAFSESEKQAKLLQYRLIHNKPNPELRLQLFLNLSI